MRSRRSFRRWLDAVIGEIALERTGGASVIGKRHVGVGPEQIESVAGKARGPVLGSPGKDTQQQILPRTECSKLGVGRAVDMDLPVHACERGEVVRAVGRDPGQAISGMHMPGHAPAERALAVVQHDLRDGAEQKLAHRFKADGKRKQHRRNAGAQDVGDAAFGAGKAEHAIGCRNQPPRKADPFSLVAVE